MDYAVYGLGLKLSNTQRNSVRGIKYYTNQVVKYALPEVGFTIYKDNHAWAPLGTLPNFRDKDAFMAIDRAPLNKFWLTIGSPKVVNKAIYMAVEYDAGFGILVREVIDAESQANRSLKMGDFSRGISKKEEDFLLSRFSNFEKKKLNFSYADLVLLEETRVGIAADLVLVKAEYNLMWVTEEDRKVNMNLSVSQRGAADLEAIERERRQLETSRGRDGSGFVSLYATAIESKQRKMSELGKWFRPDLGNPENFWEVELEKMDETRDNSRAEAIRTVKSTLAQQSRMESRGGDGSERRTVVDDTAGGDIGAASTPGGGATSMVTPSVRRQPNKKNLGFTDSRPESRVSQLTSEVDVLTLDDLEKNAVLHGASLIAHFNKAKYLDPLEKKQWRTKLADMLKWSRDAVRPEEHLVGDNTGWSVEMDEVSTLIFGVWHHILQMWSLDMVDLFEGFKKVPSGFVSHCLEQLAELGTGESTFYQYMIRMRQTFALGGTAADTRSNIYDKSAHKRAVEVWKGMVREMREAAGKAGQAHEEKEREKKRKEEEAAKEEAHQRAWMGELAANMQDIGTKPKQRSMSLDIPLEKRGADESGEANETRYETVTQEDDDDDDAFGTMYTYGGGDTTRMERIEKAGPEISGPVLEKLTKIRDATTPKLALSASKKQ